MFCCLIKYNLTKVYIFFIDFKEIVETVRTIIADREGMSYEINVTRLYINRGPQKPDWFAVDVDTDSFRCDEPRYEKIYYNLNPVTNDNMIEIVSNRELQISSCTHSVGLNKIVIS